MFRHIIRNEVGDGEESTGYTEPDPPDPFKTRSSFKFFSKVFPPKSKFRRTRLPCVIERPQSPITRNQPFSSPRQRENIFPEEEREEILYQSDLEGYTVPPEDPRYNVLYIDENRNQLLTEGNAYAERHREGTIQGKEAQILTRREPYFEVVNVMDRGTEPCNLMPAKPAVTDKSTDPPYPRECDLPSCEKERAKLNEELARKEQMVKSGLEEGNLMLEDLEKIKRHLCTSGKIPEVISTCLSVKKENPADFLHLSRKCLMELGKFSLNVQKQTESEIDKLKNELNIVKKDRAEKEEKILSLKRKINVQSEKVHHEDEENAVLQSKIKKLQEALETGKKMFKDSEISYKNKIEKLEADLMSEKETKASLSKSLDEKDFLFSRLQEEIRLLESSIESNRQQLKEIHSSYKAKISKMEQEHTNKLSSLCENQTLTNEQLSKALDKSSNYVNQLQEAKKESAALMDANKALHEKVTALEREVTKARERSVVAERRLAQETQEVMALKSQVSEVEKLESMKEEELLSVDGDIWCQIMYQHDQWIMEDLRNSLQEKEIYLETLRAQGDCALRDFEKVQQELQQRRQQYNELKDVFLEFEKKRDNVVREQRDFYNKMMLLSKKNIPRDRFFKNLIEECQNKTNKIGELEITLRETNLALEEAKKISGAQLKAMQTELQYTAEKLYEFENQIKIKEMQLQEVIKAFEQEKKNKVSAEEAAHTYKILLEDTKKENTEIRNKLNHMQDLEKNRTSVKAAEDLASETQKRKETERKLKKLEKELMDLKKILQGSKAGSSSPHSQKSAQSSRGNEELQARIQELQENKKYMERILMESQRSKEQLQRDHQELYNKMRHAVKVMVESKRNQEELEKRLDQRGYIIQKLQRGQAETESRLEELKEILHEMKKTIELLYRDREELEEKLSNHTHCHAERAVQQELKALQRDKAVLEEQNSREKDLLLRRIKDLEATIKEQQRHIRGLQDESEDLKLKIRDAKMALAHERHSHTQQLVGIQSEK